MKHEFDQDYWQSHWQQSSADEAGLVVPPSPYLAIELDGLPPGSALDVGCGTGAEALWLAAHGWQVSGLDISAAALERARALEARGAERSGASVRWVEADLGRWEPAETFDLVTTHYAHSDMPQLALYERIAGWVAPGGTLLIVGHLQTADTHGHGHADAEHGHDGHPPAEASVTATSVTAVLDGARWDVLTAAEHDRTITGGTGRAVPLRDVVVRATRR